ncbi:uncharacterized protein LOC124373504 [Homalodisca vitripennis]|uniref:uncharacterized protein LOC124373504 n=1 Tax=Homalodisca vitripennis TaxID=197043 RepID=UPI001EE9BFCD|nr:uncharacterized protein LOC124373504 [Homalodisca vitripennis]
MDSDEYSDAWILPLARDRYPITAEPSQEEKNRAIISDGLNLLLYMGILAVFIGIAMYLDHKKRTRVYAIDDPQDPSNKGIPWHLYDPNFRFDPNERNAILRYSMRPGLGTSSRPPTLPSLKKKQLTLSRFPRKRKTEQEPVKC